jgi:hypothetical protein
MIILARGKGHIPISPPFIQNFNAADKKSSILENVLGI